MPVELRVWAVEGIPEIVAGDDLAEIIGDALRGTPLEDGDILCVTSKIVSKAEGRMILAADREEAITAETVRVVATRAHPGGVTRIVENRLGIVSAAAGVDSSNTPEGTVLLLPVDPDASARALAADLRARFGVTLGIVVSDTLGRPWREGQTDVAIGAAGIRVVDDLRGTTDAGGRPLHVTLPAVADEIAAATDLVKGKAAALPVAVVRGLGHLVGDLDLPGAHSIVRPAERAMFRLGTAEARAGGPAAGYDEGYAAGYDEGVAEGAIDQGDYSESDNPPQ
jgi:coenzyme F420-0:L-glutamate ligase/coenzyme F420-1:gamma-L-glutamate ligase